MILTTSLVLVLSFTFASAQEPCTWAINSDLPANNPLYIKPGGSLDILGFWLPQTGDIVSVAPGDQVLFACTGSLLNHSLVPEEVLSCIGGKLWQDANANVIDFSAIDCQKIPFHTARYTGTPCDIDAPSYRLIEVGYELTDGSFYKIMEHCLDYENSNSIYSVFLQTPEIRGYQSGYPRPSFLQGSGFYPSGMSVNTLYTFNSQFPAVAEAVGSTDLAAAYLINGTDYYLARGHLTAKADFVYGTHHRATFWFMNVAPQWQTFNGENWAILEDNCRTYVETYPNGIYVYTGTHGTMTLADINGNQVPIYLDNTGLIRVPFIFWKVMFDPVTGLGVAFVGLNNPHYSNPGSDFYLCPNVCDQLTWLTWSPNDQQAGYSYCCEVPALTANVPEIPILPVTGLLT